MYKFLILIAVIFAISLVAPIGQTIQNALTENYTWASTVPNATLIGWFVAYSMSWWWLIPLAILIIVFINFMKRDEPEPYSMVMPQQRMPRQPKQPKPVKQTKQKQPPNIFLGR